MRLINNNQEQKVVTTDDIIVSSDKSSSTVLTDVIDLLSQDSMEAKSNIKWLAAHRGYGTGSGGSGGGGGTSLTPEFLLYVGDMTTNITKGTTDIILNGLDTYPIKVKVNRSLGHAFSIVLKVDNSITKINLPVDSSYEYTVNKFLLSNGTISVTGIDLDTGDDLETLSYPYLTESLSYNFSLKNNLTGEITPAESKEILSENAHNYSMLIDYKCALSGVSATYTEINSYKTANNLQLTTGDLDYNGKIEGELEIANLFPNSNAIFGLYKIGFDIVQTWEGKSTNFSKNIIFTIIPATYFELYSLDLGTVFNTLEEAKHANSSDLVTAGYLPLIFKWYIGQQTTGYETYALKVERLTKDNTYKESGIGFNNVSIKIRTDTNLSNYGLNIYYSDAEDSQKISIIENKITYTYLILRLSMTRSDGSTSYRYLAIKEPEKSYTWPEAGSFGILSYDRVYYYRSNSDKSDSNLPIPARHITVNTPSPDDGLNNLRSVNICLGIQYSRYSKENSTIAYISNGSTNIITFTLSSVVINGLLISYYLPTLENLNKSSTDPDDWALIDLNILYVKTVGSAAYVDISLYVNGDLCGELQSLQMLERGGWKSLTITDEWSGYVNLYDVSFYSTKTKIDDTHLATYTPWDIAAVMYYNKYIKTLNEKNTSNDTTELLNTVLSSSKLLTDTSIGLQYLTSNNDFKTISKFLPVVLLQISGSGQKTASQWLQEDWLKPYTNETDDVLGQDAKLYYYLDGSEPSYNDAYTFSIQVQGSSSKLYRSKNIQLTIKNKEESDNKVLFTPNYIPVTENMSAEEEEAAYLTFLPEESFVLKADVVDSSMCNNNAIGNFVNKYTTKFKTVVDSKEDYAPYIKNCLLGFPVLVVFEVDTKYYIMGVYNFNLGRDSYGNLGYYTKDYYTNVFKTLNTKDSSGSMVSGKFLYVTIPTPIVSEDLYMAEVSNGDHWFDFSQYNKNLLTNKSKGMFSHITLVGSKDYSDKLVTFVKLVSKAGGYIFDTMKKNRIDLGTLSTTAFPYREGTLDKTSGLYVSGNYVSDYTKLYTLNNNNEYVFSTTDAEAVSSDLTSLISEGTADNPNTPMLDYRSVCEYYTIVMIFGMVDSVMKNLEIKSWTILNPTPTFYAAFYDMDTANGKNNAGGKTNYVAFSDYWQSINNKNLLKGIKIYRDYWPNFSSSTKAESGYDIPMTYLLAIGKYAQLKWKNTNTNTTSSLAEGSLYLPSLLYNNQEYEFSPLTLYASYRRIGGPLESAKKFVKNFYKARLKNVPLALININYRNKYFNLQLWDRGTSSLDYGSDSVRNGGNELAYIEDWLDSRLKMLDSYFFVNPNMALNIQYCTISKTTDDSGVTTTNYNWETNGHLNIVTNEYGNILCLNSLSGDLLQDVLNNEDVNILQSILGRTPLKMEFASGVNTIDITAPKDSISLIQYSDSNFTNVILPDALNKYTISVGAAGNNSINYYGSNVWKTISNIGSMLGSLTSGIYTITSKYLTKIYGLSNNKIEGGLILNCPNVTSILLNNNSIAKTYLGDLKISNDTVGLTYLNISNTKFDIKSLNNDNYNNFSLMPNLTSVVLDGCESSEIDLTAISNLNSLSLRNTIITTFACNTWTKDITLNEASQKFTNLTIIGKNANSLTITGTNNNLTSKLNTLRVTNINTLTIQNCPNLSLVYISGVKTLRIINCSLNSDLSVTKNNGTGTPRVITIPNDCEAINFYATTGFDTVNLETGRATPVYCLDDCFRETKVKEITNLYVTSNNDPKYLYFIGDRAFYKVSTLSLLDGNKKLLPIHWGIGNINNGQLSITSRSANSAFELFHPTNGNTNANWITLLNSMEGTYVTSAVCMFRDCPIPAASYNESVNLGNSLHLTNATNVDGIFRFTKIRWYTKELMNFPKITGMNKCTLYVPNSSRDLFMYFTTDFLRYCGGNVTYYDCSAENSLGYPIEWRNPNGSEITNTRASDLHRRILASDVLKYLPKIQTLCLIFINTYLYIDLYNAFLNNRDLRTINGFIWKDTYAYNYTWHVTDTEDNITYSSIFSNLPKITSILYLGEANIAPKESGYMLGDTYTDGDYIDYIHLFTENLWKAILNGSISFNQSIDYTYRSMAFLMYKYITLEDFSTILTYLSGQSRWLGFFLNCIITDASTDLILFLNIPVLSRVSEFYKTFSNFRVADIENKKQYALILSENFRTYLPNCTGFTWAFSGTIQKTVFPYNFWNNRDSITDIETINGYIPETRVITTTSTDSKGKTTTTTVKSTIKVPVKGKYFNYNSSNITNLLNMFANVYWDVKNVFNPFNNLPSNLSISGTTDEEKYTSLLSLAKLYSTLYKCKTNNNGLYLNSAGEIIDDSNTADRVWEEVNTNVYYVNGSRRTLRPATEFSDVLTPAFLNGDLASNYGLYQNVNIKLSDNSILTLAVNYYTSPTEVYPILPTDFFYNLNLLNSAIGGVFSGLPVSTTFSYIQNTTSYNILYTPSSGSNGILMGYLPQHLYSNALITLASNTIANQIVLPIKQADITEGSATVHIYSFVPKEFVPNTMTVLDNAFNFLILLPNYKSATEYDRYFIFRKDSFVNRSAVASMSYGLPSYIQRTSTSGGTTINITNFAANPKVDTNYYLMGDSDNKYSICTFSEFSNLKHYNLITGRLTEVLEGNLFNPNKNLDSVNILSGLGYLFNNFLLHDGNYSVINAKLIFPVLNVLASTKYILPSGLNNLLINRSSLNNSTTNFDYSSDINIIG